MNPERGQDGHCTSCGETIESTARFCPKCGSEISPPSGAESIPSSSPGQPGEPDPNPSSEPEPTAQIPKAGPTDANPTSRNRKRVLALAGALVLVAGAAAALTVVLIKDQGNQPSAVQQGVPAATSTRNYTSFQALYAVLKGSVARIDTVQCDGTPETGTGFAVDAHHIVTADHVLGQAQSLTVTINRSPIPARVTGIDQSGDLALLQTPAAIPGAHIPLGPTDPAIGQQVAALGYPLGGDLTLTEGTVSALKQSLSINSIQLAGLVETDTPLNPGNSGGPLVALDGMARGIVDASNNQANNVGYALGPGFARTEVQSWIASPESHPLPLCGSSGQSSAQAAALPGEQGAASQLAGLLQQSANARTTVVAATQAVTACADPASQISQMQQAIDLRQGVLNSLGQVQVGSIPNGSTMISDLTTALQASSQADQDFIAWMNDVEGAGCPVPTTSDSNYQAASNASSTATTAKDAFVALWNPVAQQFGLTQFAQSDL